MNAIAHLLAGALSGGRAVALPLAFAGGVVAGLNPCCLALYPAAAATCCAVRGPRVRLVFWSAVAFVVGVSSVTAVLGVAAALAGGAIGGLGSWVYYLVAAVPLAMGLHVLGWLRLPLPRPGRLSARQGLAGAFVTGALLSVVLAPCGTPVLASVLSYAAYQRSAAYGGLLLFAYGLGAGVPVALAGMAAGGLGTRLSDPRWQRWVNRITGAGLIGIGLYLVWVA